VVVKAILGHQFADVPGTRQPDLVTMLEEEKIMAYYGGGTLYADPERQEPLV
jgi:photosynthetic reaction center H subunit